MLKCSRNYQLCINRSTKVALLPNLWARVELQRVDKLPYDVDCLVQFQLPFEKEARMESSKDGRPWGVI